MGEYPSGTFRFKKLCGSFWKGETLRFADYTGSYSIKIYTSKKSFDEEGNWAHEEILLLPKNSIYSPIVIEEENADEFRIVGEFIGVLQTETK